jgi:signal transduction histidine kinase
VSRAIGHSRRLAAALLALLAVLGLPLALEQAAAPAPQWRVVQAVAGETVDDERLRATVLPHLWRLDCRDCTTRWYRIDRSLVDLPRDAQVIYLPLAADNAAIYLNGRLLGQGGRFTDPVARLGARPLWVSAPAALWQPGENRLYILLKAERARFGRMPALAIAGEGDLMRAWQLRQALAVTLPQVAATAAVMLALIMGVLAGYRRSEPGHLALALSAALFGADAFARLVVEPPLAGTAWDAMLAALRLALGTAVFILGWRLAHPPGALAPAPGDAGRFHATNRSFGALTLGGATSAAAALAAATALEPSGLGLESVELTTRLALAAAGATLVFGGRQVAHVGQAEPLKTPARTAGATLVVAALVDLWRLSPLTMSPAAEALPIVPWALAALFGVVAWTLLLRFVQTLNAAELLNIDLEALVRERTSALEAQFERVRELERRETIAAERERLMRDMHDGVGGHLVSMLAMIEADRRRPGELAQVVREALDDMRLMIDSLEPVDDDLNAVLAMFHDRLAPRLRGAGVALHWNVEMLPQVAGLTPARVLHLLRMLQEAVTNALRHGRAHRVWISAEQAAGGVVRIEVRDDGAGFDLQQVQASGGGRGLKNLARRAREIGATLVITSAPGAGACVHVAWEPPGSDPAP